MSKGKWIREPEDVLDRRPYSTILRILQAVSESPRHGSLTQSEIHYLLDGKRRMKTQRPRDLRMLEEEANRWGVSVPVLKDGSSPSRQSLSKILRQLCGDRVGLVVRDRQNGPYRYLIADKYRVMLIHRVREFNCRAIRDQPSQNMVTYIDEGWGANSLYFGGCHYLKQTIPHDIVLRAAKSISSGAEKARDIILDWYREYLRERLRQVQESRLHPYVKRQIARFVSACAVPSQRNVNELWETYLHDRQKEEFWREQEERKAKWLLEIRERERDPDHKSEVIAMVEEVREFAAQEVEFRIGMDEDDHKAVEMIDELRHAILWRMDGIDLPIDEILDDIYGSDSCSGESSPWKWSELSSYFEERGLNSRLLSGISCALVDLRRFHLIGVSHRLSPTEIFKSISREGNEHDFPSYCTFQDIDWNFSKHHKTQA